MIRLAPIAVAALIAACGSKSSSEETGAERREAREKEAKAKEGKKEKERENALSCAQSSRFEQACRSRGDAAACARAAECFFEGKWGHALDTEKSFAYAEKACDGGHAFGCSLLGFHYQDGLGTEWDPKKAVAAYEKACEKKAGVGCYNLASMYLGGHGIKADTPRGEEYKDLAQKHWRAACDGDEPRWCTNLAFLIHREESETTATIKQVLELNERACEHGFLVGCTEAARSRMDLGEISTVEFIDALKRLCDRRVLSACAIAGAALISGSMGAPGNPQEGVALLLRACDLGDKHSCESIAMEHARGQLLEQDFDAATRYLDMACDRALGRACFTIAQDLLSRGKRAEAAAYAQRACQMGQAEACAALSDLHLSGEGIPKDEAAGIRWARESCRMGFPRACGLLIQRRLELPVPPDMKQTFYTQACKRGDQASCARLQRLRRRSNSDHLETK